MGSLVRKPGRHLLVFVPQNWLIRRRFEPRHLAHCRNSPPIRCRCHRQSPRAGHAPASEGCAGGDLAVGADKRDRAAGPSTSLPPSGQGTSTIWELATDMLPLLSLAIAIGRSKTPLTWRIWPLPMMATELLLLPVTQAKPRWSMATPNGLESPSWSWGCCVHAGDPL